MDYPNEYLDSVFEEESNDLESTATTDTGTNQTSVTTLEQHHPRYTRETSHITTVTDNKLSISSKHYRGVFKNFKRFKKFCSRKLRLSCVKGAASAFDLAKEITQLSTITLDSNDTVDCACSLISDSYASVDRKAIIHPATIDSSPKLVPKFHVAVVKPTVTATAATPQSLVRESFSLVSVTAKSLVAEAESTAGPATRTVLATAVLPDTATRTAVAAASTSAADTKSAASAESSPRTATRIAVAEGVLNRVTRLNAVTRTVVVAGTSKDVGGIAVATAGVSQSTTIKPAAGSSHTLLQSPIADSPGTSCESISETEGIWDINSIEKTFTKMSRRRRIQSIPGVKSPLTRQQDVDKQSSIDAESRPRHCSSLRSSPSRSTMNSMDTGALWMNPINWSREFTPATSNENLCEVYRQVLSCIINPLGCADVRPGFSPSELAEMLREIFQVDARVHSSVMEEVKRYKPSNVVVNVGVIEARDLKHCACIDRTNPYCVVTVDDLYSTRPSPATSPRSSPTQRRKSKFYSFETADNICQTEPQKSTQNPQWKEQFELPVKDLESQAVHILVMNTSIQSSLPDTERNKLKDRRASFKGLFRHIRSSMDSTRNNCNRLGYLSIPLTEIPVCGCDTWFQLLRDKRQKSSLQGQLRLRLQLSYKQFKQTDSASASFLQDCSVSDYHRVVLHIYKHSLTSGNSSPEQRFSPSITSNPFCRINERSRAVMNQFAIQIGICCISQHIIELAVVLEMKTTGQFSQLLPDKLLNDVMDGVIQECKGVLFDEQSYEAEKSILIQAVGTYLQSIQSNIQFTNPLFPPTEIRLQELNSQVGICADLLNLQLWNDYVGAWQPRHEFSFVFIRQIQEDLNKWITSRLELAALNEKESIISKTQAFTMVVKEAITALTSIISINDFFHQLRIDYFKVASLAIEVKISSMAQELTQEMDRYQLKYHRFHVNIRDSSVVSLQHYFTLRSLFRTICANVSGREMFRVSLSRYQDWFRGAVTFWLQTFREECQKRMEKALSLDKDVVQVAAQVKYSNSSVDILSSFSKMISEWEQVDFCDVDIVLLGVTKITDMICDCVKLYAERIVEILEKNGFYDYIDKQFDITDQLCISLNNLSHISGYLVELSALLHWDSVTERLSIKHENQLVGQMALRALQNIVTTTDEEMLHTCRILAQRIIQRIAVNLRKYTMLFTRCTDADGTCDKEVEPLLDYLENNLQILYKKLESNIFPLFLEEIWRTEVRIFSETVLEGQSPEYYRKMLMHLNSLKSYFHSGGAGVLMVSLEQSQAVTTACKIYSKLMKTLEINSLTSEALILEYYKNLVNNVARPVVYYGQMTVKVGFKQDTEAFVTLHAKVVHAKHLPGMSSKDLSNPFITLTLCPLTLFPHNHQCKTSVQYGTVNPGFGEVFEFGGISNESLRTEGAVIVFSVWHYVALLPNDFLGEVVLPLSRLREIATNQDVDDIPAVITTLSRPREPRDGPYQILRERAISDKTSEQLIHQRSSIIAFHTGCKLCKPMKCIVSTLTGKKLEVVGKRDSITTIEE